MTEVATATKAKKEIKAPVQISVKGVLADLDAGLDREKIKAKYQISHSDMALLFKDPALKGRKPKGAVRTKKAPGFVLVQDAGEVAATSTKASETGLVDAALAEAPETAKETEKVTEQAPVAEALDKW